jgi:hypothetical protein
MQVSLPSTHRRNVSAKRGDGDISASWIGGVSDDNLAAESAHEPE